MFVIESYLDINAQQMIIYANKIESYVRIINVLNIKNIHSFRDLALTSLILTLQC